MDSDLGDHFARFQRGNVQRVPELRAECPLVVFGHVGLNSDFKRTIWLFERSRHVAQALKVTGDRNRETSLACP
jgi:hypothetical protein